MTFIYLATLFFAFVMSIVPAAQFILDPVFTLMGLGAGLKTPFIVLLIVIGMAIIFMKSPNNSLKSEFINIFKWWIPWLIYLLIRSGFGGIGFWKFEMYIARLFIPTLAIVLVYLSCPDKFERYFFGLLIFLATLLVPLLYLIDFAEKDFYNNIWLSRTLAICSLYLYVSLSYTPGSLVKMLLIGFFFVAMVLIGSRGPVLSFLLSATLFFMIKNRSNIKNLLAAGLVSVVVTIVVVQVSGVNVASNVASFLTHGKSDEIAHVEKADDRTGIYPGTIDIVLDYPIIGVGLAKWHIVYYKQQGLYNDGEYKYPHNFLLEVWSELGLIGLILFLSLFKPTKRLFSIDNRYNIFIVLGLLFASTSSDITQNSAPIMFAILSYILSRRVSDENIDLSDNNKAKINNETVSKEKYQSVKLRN